MKCEACEDTSAELQMLPDGKSYCKSCMDAHSPRLWEYAPVGSELRSSLAREAGYGRLHGFRIVWLALITAAVSSLMFGACDLVWSYSEETQTPPLFHIVLLGGIFLFTFVMSHLGLRRSLYVVLRVRPDLIIRDGVVRIGDRFRVPLSKVQWTVGARSLDRSLPGLFPDPMTMVVIDMSNVSKKTRGSLIRRRSWPDVLRARVMNANSLFWAVAHAEEKRELWESFFELTIPERRIAPPPPATKE